jgi:hypothetical protein
MFPKSAGVVTAYEESERADVSRSAAMAMVGHKTEAIYRRYAIADESMLRDASAKLSALHRSDATTIAKPKVVRLEGVGKVG